VLIHGESGTGKELTAKALHSISGRKGPLVARNAATFPETLIDAELFGNAKGYPNPGMQERPGLIGAAHGGTLFLDEFAELPLTQQTRLLRVLDAGEYQRLGDAALRKSSARLVAATNRPLSALRPDVLARFAFTVETPSLAVRLEDVSLLVRHILIGIAKEDTELNSKGFFARDGEPNLSAELLTLLIRRSTPGNVRDLRNILWRSLAESRSDKLSWPPSVQATERVKAAAAASVALPDDEAERIRQALDQHGGSIEQTWRSLGLSSRFALNRLMKKHGISLRKQSS
jgi:DNA-binding NtrC family response regulator